MRRRGRSSGPSFSYHELVSRARLLLFRICQQYSLTSPTHSFNSASLYVLASPAGSHSFTLTIPMNINRAYTPQPPPLSSKAEVFVFWVVFFFVLFFISKYADSVLMSHFFFPALFFHHSLTSPSAADVKACVSHQTSQTFS